jgi:hypothetical protein
MVTGQPEWNLSLHVAGFRPAWNTTSIHLLEKNTGAVNMRRHKMSKHTPGPWSLCNDGEKCKCGQIWSADFPIAKVTKGKWGDPYPAIRPVGGSIGRQYEAYIELIEYGEVPEDVAMANGRLIARAPELLEQNGGRGVAEDRWSISWRYAADCQRRSRKGGGLG